MRADPVLMELLPPRFRRNRLDSDQVRDLVKTIDAGFSSPANLEICAEGWRLRLTINLSSGGSVRRGFTIPDDDTAKWVEEYLEDARERWREARRQGRRGGPAG